MSDPITDLKQELLAAAERQHGDAAVRGGGRGSPNEIWIDDAAPNRYRAILYGFPPDHAPGEPGTTACSHTMATELGGTFDLAEDERQPRA
jgi:hypothetical protein